jgi:hypothetical protein
VPTSRPATAADRSIRRPRCPPAITRPSCGWIPSGCATPPRHLEQRPGPLELIEVDPGTAGERATAAAVAAFTGAYRAAVTVLTADDDAAARHLADAADTYLTRDTFHSPA